ncbi:MAG: DUF2867 domain-containing protein [Beutenbergiaceae bacterium]
MTSRDRQRTPRFDSLALAGEFATPDFADVQIVPVRRAAGLMPRDWAQLMFAVSSTPLWVRVLFAIRAVIAPLFGIDTRREAASDPFAVQEVHGQEALLDTDAPHLRFRCAVGVDDERGLLRVTTAVLFNNWRGRLYFIPVDLLHGPVIRAMMRRAVRRGSTRRWRRMNAARLRSA